MELGVGGALVSTLDAKGALSVVERTLICPAHRADRPAKPEEERQAVLAGVQSGQNTTTAIDRDSAYEKPDVAGRPPPAPKSMPQRDERRRCAGPGQAQGRALGRAPGTGGGASAPRPAGRQREGMAPAFAVRRARRRLLGPVGRSCAASWVRC